MKRFAVVLFAIAACSGNRVERFGPVALDMSRVEHLPPFPEYATWWGEVATLVSVSPAISFPEVSWWTAGDLPLQCHDRKNECYTTGFFVATKDVILLSGHERNECVVKHEMAHVILGRGNEAHGDPLFAIVRQSCSRNWRTSHRLVRPTKP